MKKVVFYHLNDLPGWNELMSDQLTKMSESGLLEEADTVYLCTNGNPASFTAATAALKEYENVHWHHVSDRYDLWEYPTLDFLKKTCDSSTEEFYVAYIHLKGLSRPADGPRRNWREFMDYWTIERWEDNIKTLDQNYDTVGVNYNDSDRGQNGWPHYSGNFWWARASYIRKLTPLVNPLAMQWGTPSTLLIQANGEGVRLDPGNFRFEHEAWIGSENPAYFEIAYSPGKYDHDFHQHQLYPRERFTESVNQLLKK